MFDAIMDFLKPAAEVVTLVTGSPIAAAVTAGLEIIDKVEDATDEQRTDMYLELADGLADASKLIIRAAADGEITEEEHKRIIGELKKLAAEL